MENRINRTFKALQASGRKALIPFIVAGDPCLKATKALVLKMADAGADIIELGIPYSDPLADGPVIQAAVQRALEGGVTITKVIEAVKDIRLDTQIPLALLVYFNPIFNYGQERFVKDIAGAGVDAMIVPDLPLEERLELGELAMCYGVTLIPLAAPTSGERIAGIVKDAGGFVYCVSSTGVTGMRQAFHSRLQVFLDEVKQNTDLPRAIGFGISGCQTIRQLKPLAEGFIVGSAIVKLMEESKNDAEMLENVYGFVSSLRKELDRA